MGVFFPGVAAAWVWLAALTALLAVASWYDLRKYLIPKPVSLALLGVGVVLTLVRGAWLGAEGHSAWVLDPGPALGALDAFLFSLAGFLTGFGLFFAMWLLGLCGGGDVKLSAAVGAWVGPKLFLACLFFSVVFVLLFGVGRIVVRFLRRGKLSALRSPGGPNRTTADRMKARILTYSLPLTLAVILTMLAVMPHEFGLVPPPAAGPQK